MRQVAALKALAEHVAGRVHPSVADDPLAAVRHRGFIAAHLGLGVLPFAAIPVLLALGGAPTAVEVAGFGWLVAPILIALQLSRSGDLVRAHVLSAFSITALIATVAAMTGGTASAALPWLVLGLLEAALSGSLRAVLVAGLGCLAAGLTVLGLGLGGALPQPVAFGGGVTAVGVFAAGLYVLGLALRAFSVIGAGSALGREDRARFDLFADSVSELVTRHGPNGAVSFASPASTALVGVAPRELMGQGLFERVHIADRPLFLHAIASGGDEPVTVELRVRRDSAEAGPRAPQFVWLEMRARTAGPGLTLASFRDVTERKAHEEALLLAREQADRASIAKTRFLATMSHELRTPLNAIIGFSEILADDRLPRPGPERRADYAGLIHQSGVHLLDLVNGILDMSKIEAGAFTVAPEACQAAPIVAHCMSLLALKAERSGVRLTADVAQDLPDVIADRRALTQITLNLLSNAVKFTANGGDVTVALRVDGRSLMLSVSDNGCGVAPEHVGRLGEAFFQADASYDRRQEGAGLGLSVVRGLVDLHGGRLVFDSALGRGTRVTVCLPLDGASAAASRRDAAVERPAFGRPRSAPSPLLTKVKKSA